MKILFGDEPVWSRGFSEHSHSSWEALFCLVGTGTMIIDGQEYPYSEGSVFCIPPNVTHSKQSDGEGLEQSIYTLEKPVRDAREIPCYQDNEISSGLTLLRTAFQLRALGADYANEVVEAVVNSIFLMLSCVNAFQRKSNDQVNSFLEVLNCNLTNVSFDLTEAIGQTGYSAAHFRKLFKCQMGMSPLAYFNRIRIERAENLLNQSGGRISVKELATSSGFSDPSYFSRMFKNKTGFSPSEYCSRQLLTVQEPGEAVSGGG